jgi:hypothetical protein
MEAKASEAAAAVNVAHRRAHQQQLHPLKAMEFSALHLLVAVNHEARASLAEAAPRGAADPRVTRPPRRKLEREAHEPIQTISSRKNKTNRILWDFIPTVHCAALLNHLSIF